MAPIFITLRIIFRPPLLKQLGVGRGDGQIGVGEHDVMFEIIVRKNSTLESPVRAESFGL